MNTPITGNVSDQKIGLIELVVAMFLMGTVGYFVVESGQAPHNVVFFRCVFGVLFLFAYCLLAGHFKNTGISRKSLSLIVLSGLFLVCNWVMLFASFKTASISTSTVIYHAQPFFFVIIAAVVFRESIPQDKVLWMVLAFIGVLLVAELSGDTFSLSSSYLLGICLALSAAIFWAISAMIVKQLKGIKPHLIALIQLGIGVLVLMPFTDFEAATQSTGMQWGYLVILGSIHTCLVYILMYSSYQKLTTTVIAVLTFIYPAVAILVDFVAYGVSLHAWQWLGVFLIMVSSFGVNQNIAFKLFKRKERDSTAEL